MTEEMKQDSDNVQIEEGGNIKSRSIMPGVMLITLGLIFLANNLTGFELENWWALFILIPGISNFAEGVRAYRRDGEFSRKARGYFFGSLFMILLSAAFLFGLNFGTIWPAFLILGGLGILLGAL